MTPSSARSRPDEPPSSATVTTAVTSNVKRLTAWSVANNPCPPPSATMAAPRVSPASDVSVHSFAPQIPVHDADRDVVLGTQTPRESFGHGYASVLTAGAPTAIVM